MFRSFLVLFVVLFSFGFSKPGDDGLIDYNQSFREIVEEFGIKNLPFIKDCVNSNCTLDSLIVFDETENGDIEWLIRKHLFEKRKIGRKNKFRIFVFSKILIYRHSEKGYNNDFKIKINNGVIEEIKWVDDELYEPNYKNIKYGEYYFEHGWKHANLENKYGLHLNVHTGKKTDAGGNSWPSH